jgi:cell division initiation protein
LRENFFESEQTSRIFFEQLQFNCAVLTMRLTPIEIKKHGFKKATFGGYEADEVDAFMETVSRQWEELLDEAEKLKRRIAELEGETRKYKDVEGMLHQTLAQAQKSTSDVIDNAKREAELIKQEASLKASQAIERARHEVSAMQEDIRQLDAHKREVLAKLKMLVVSQTELINAFSHNEDSFVLNALAARKQSREIEAHKSEPAKSEPAKSEPAKSEPPKTESQQSDVVKPEVVQRDTPIVEPPSSKTEIPKADIPKTDIPKTDSPKADIPKSDAALGLPVASSPMPVTAEANTAPINNTQFNMESLRAMFHKQSATETTATVLETTNIIPEKLESGKIELRAESETPSAKHEIKTDVVKEQTIRVEIPVETAFKSSGSKRSVNIDDILDSLD